MRCADAAVAGDNGFDCEALTGGWINKMTGGFPYNRQVYNDPWKYRRKVVESRQNTDM